MLGVLQRYTLREVLVPSAMALGTFAFVLLVQTIFTDDEMSVVGSASVLLTVALYLLPSLLTPAIPMAILTGVLLGIGRMTVDSEIKACRTHGVNLFKVFAPVLVCGAAASALVLFNSLYFAPWMLSCGWGLLDRLKVELVDAIRPGMFEKVRMDPDTEVVLHFGDRNPDTGELENVKMWFEGAPGVLSEETKSRIEEGAKTGIGTTETLESLKSRGLGSGGLFDPSADAPPSVESLAVETPTSATVSREARGGRDAATTATQASVPPKTRFMASSGRIEIDARLDRPKATLALRNGSIHVARGEMDSRYTVVAFKQMRHVFTPSAESDSVGKLAPAKDIGALRREIARYETQYGKYVLEGGSKKKAMKSLGFARILRAEMWQRVSLALACFVFVLIGLPLAIYIRPSGKSVGVSVAFLLILAYYGVWHYGLQLTRGGLWFGPGVVFLPNLLLTIIGAVMLHRTVHR